MKVLTASFAVCLLAFGADASLGDGAQTGVYVFDADLSAVVQTGGFAGVHETYPVEGPLGLTVDAAAGTAAFEWVDARLTETSPFLYTQSLGVLFNMLELAGGVVSQNTIEFTGKASDDSNIVLSLVFTNGSVEVTGRTIAPPGSADFFEFELDGVAVRSDGGTGTPNDPYLIYTPKQMNAIGAEPNDWDKYFRLMADIDLDGVQFNVIGDFARPFSGVFDGGGHAISNLACTGGLFRNVHGPDARIKNLRLIDPNVVGGPQTGALVAQLGQGTVSNCCVRGGGTSNGIFYTGGLIGTNHSGTMEECFTSGRVSASRHTLGGLVGYNGDQGTVVDCGSSADVTSLATGGEVAVGGLVGENRGGIGRCWSTGSVSGRYSVGGLVGFNGGGAVADCYSRSAVAGEQIGVGGLVGANGAIVSRCYAAGPVTGENDVGGLVGRNSASVTDSYWDVETSGQAGSAGGVGKTTNEMKQRSSYIDWDFVEVWNMAERQTYPFLRRHPIGDLNSDRRVDMFDLVALLEHWLEGGQ